MGDVTVRSGQTAPGASPPWTPRPRKGSAVPRLGRTWWPWQPGGQPRPPTPSEPTPPPGSGGWREPGRIPPAAPGPSAKLCATLLRPGSEPALPPVGGDLQDCALYLPDTEGAFTVTIATRIDRWGSGAGGGPRCLSIHLPVLSRLPCLPQRLSVPAEQQRAGREPWDPSLPGSLAGSVAALALGARRPTVSCLPQALHSQPGKAGAASPGGTCGA